MSADSGHPLEWTEEQNYMFQLSYFKDDLLKWLGENGKCQTNSIIHFSYFVLFVDSIVRPAKFQKILIDLINTLEEDLSVSRPSSRVHWGIHVPGDSSQSIYVWLDALGNYLTAAKYSQWDEFRKVWPPDLQVIGKDILK